MGKRSTGEKLRLQAEKQAANLEARRRRLREHYPEIAPQAWSNLGDGLGGNGGRALTEWLRTVAQLVRIKTPCKTDHTE